MDSAKSRGRLLRGLVSRSAEHEDIPVVRFTKADRKIEAMLPYLFVQAATGRSGVAAIGVAQEYASVFTGTAQRRVTCFYFYLWDVDFGPAFIKDPRLLPAPAKVWLNGHERAKRHAVQTDIGFTELSNGIAATDDPAGLQALCDRLGPGTIRVFADRWPAILPIPAHRGGSGGGRRGRSPGPATRSGRQRLGDAPAVGRRR
jgi:hypothetical protein